MRGARILTGLTHAEYHADPIEPASLSQSIAHVLLSSSPAHAYQEHPRLGGGSGKEPTQEMDAGALIHRLVLGVGAPISVVAADDWRTKAAQAARDEARAAGAIPVLERVLVEAEAAARFFIVRLEERGLRLDGDSEVMLAWTEESKHGPVQCRGMLDHLKADRTVVLDLKTCQSAHPRACARKVLDSGDCVQAAAYVSAVEKLEPELAGRVRFLFVFAELKPPYAITVAEPGGILREIGRHRWERAVETWAKCLSSGVWPGYSEEVVTLEAPPWAVAELEGEVLHERI